MEKTSPPIMPSKRRFTFGPSIAREHRALHAVRGLKIHKSSSRFFVFSTQSPIGDLPTVLMGDWRVEGVGKMAKDQPVTLTPRPPHHVSRRSQGDLAGHHNPVSSATPVSRTKCDANHN
jgi:hypothetical protein